MTAYTSTTLITHNGTTKTLKAWAAARGIKVNTLRQRLNLHGWPVAEDLGFVPHASKRPHYIPLRSSRSVPMPVRKARPGEGAVIHIKGVPYARCAEDEKEFTTSVSRSVVRGALGV